MVFDVLLINVSFLTGYFIKFNALSIVFFQYYKTLALVTLIWLIVFNLGGLYKFPKREERRVDGIASLSFAITSAAFVTLLVIFFLYKEAVYAMDIIFYAWFCSLVLLNISRSVIWFSYGRFLHE